jgi:hypothetical protein
MNWLHIIQQEEEEDDNEYFFGGDDEENMIVAQYLVSVEASGSHRRRAPDASPRWPNKRDHATGVLAMHRYMCIVSFLIMCTPIWLSVGGMYESLYFLIFKFCGEYLLWSYVQVSYASSCLSSTRPSC